jgi:hypothetical protein
MRSAPGCSSMPASRIAPVVRPASVACGSAIPSRPRAALHLRAFGRTMVSAGRQEGSSSAHQHLQRLDFRTHVRGLPAGVNANFGGTSAVPERAAADLGGAPLKCARVALHPHRRHAEPRAAFGARACPRPAPARQRDLQASRYCLSIRASGFGRMWPNIAMSSMPMTW